MGPQPDHTTTTELRMVSEGDKREGPSIQRMTGIKDGDGLALQRHFYRNLEVALSAETLRNR